MVHTNHFVTAAEIKVRLEETHPGFELGEITIKDEPSRLGYTAILPKHVLSPLAMGICMFRQQSVNIRKSHSVEKNDDKKGSVSRDFKRIMDKPSRRGGTY
ncbi:hypothetical protein G9A89_001400 [Geosiphon pyriformis]|nr:hypothetical protein G9A89_001400 [Geosiphon pyriformis]